MLGLGKQVLNKIQTLLGQIDRKKVKKNDHDNMQKSKSKQRIKPARQANQSHHKKSTKREKSPIREEKQNLCSSRLQQLYLNHFVKQKKLLDRNLQNMQSQMSELKNFKVQNKKSQYLNQRKSLKPIHQRTTQILQKRQKSIQMIKQSAPKTKRQVLQQQGERIVQERKRNHPKLSKEEFERKMQEIQQRNIHRIQLLQRKKLMNLEEKSILLEKPQINPTNQVWWDQKKLKKNLSTNVFERFKQYDIEKKENWEKYLNKRKQEETPFAPRISAASKEIANKSQSRRSLFEIIPRSHSCYALSRREELSFVERRQEESTERRMSERRMSNSRNLKHGKSATTMHSSRHVLVDKKGH